METKVVSSFFVNTEKKYAYSNTKHTDISEDFLDLIDELNLALEQFNMPATVHCVYNPTIYARRTFEMYIRKYCNTKKPIMYFGMNPGPWGMSQTGVRLIVYVFLLLLHHYVESS